MRRHARTLARTDQRDQTVNRRQQVPRILLALRILRLQVMGVERKRDLLQALERKERETIGARHLLLLLHNLVVLALQNALASANHPCVGQHAQVGNARQRHVRGWCT